MKSVAFFRDRIDAGEKLATLLSQYKDKNVVIYALPRGGVAPGAEIAKRLNAPLDLIITRKIGHPYSPEYAVGAVAENGHAVLTDKEIVDIGSNWFKEETERQKLEAKRRRELYLKGRKPISCNGKIAILVDDGVATGLTIMAAVKELNLHYQPKKIIIAVPVIPVEIAGKLGTKETEVVSIITDADFLGSVGSYYQDFPTVSDSEVIN